MRTYYALISLLVKGTELLAREKIGPFHRCQLRRTHREATPIITKPILFLTPAKAQALRELRWDPIFLPTVKGSGCTGGTHRYHGRDSEGGEGHMVNTGGVVHTGGRDPG